MVALHRLRPHPASPALAVTLASRSSRPRSPLGAAPARPAVPRPRARPGRGLFGRQDPTYDGVFRQSLALLAYAAAGAAPPAEAVTWLLDQQCADGGFQAFRARTSAPCRSPTRRPTPARTPTPPASPRRRCARLGALDARRRRARVARAAQNADGGFPYFVGGDSDANSTGLVLFAHNAAGLQRRELRASTAALVGRGDFLESLQSGCGARPPTTTAASRSRARRTARPGRSDAQRCQAALGAARAPLPRRRPAPCRGRPRTHRAALASSARATARPAPPLGRRGAAARLVAHRCGAANGGDCRARSAPASRPRPPTRAGPCSALAAARRRRRRPPGLRRHRRTIPLARRRTPTSSGGGDGVDRPGRARPARRWSPTPRAAPAALLRRDRLVARPREVQHA